MKILQVFNRYLEKGGEEAFVDFFTLEAGKRHEIRNLIFDSAEWRNESFWLKVLQPLRMIYNPSSARLIRETVRDFSPDVAIIHNVFPVGSLATYRTLEKLNIPIIQYIHNFRPFSVNGYCWADGKICKSGLSRNFLPEIISGSWQNSKIKTAIYASVLSIGHFLGTWAKVNRWIAISHFMKDVFVRAGIPDQKIDVISHAIESSSPSAPPEASKNQILFMGRISEEKGIRVLAEAWKQLERLRSDGVLLIAGAGPLSEWLNQELKDCKRVEILGHVGGATKDHLLRNCRAMVVPSVWWEPFGLVVLEAYRNSKPVLASASGALAEIVVTNRTGWVHQPQDVSKLVMHMMEALDEPTEAQRRGQEGYRWLGKNASIDNWHRQLDITLNQAIYNLL